MAPRKKITVAPEEIQVGGVRYDEATVVQINLKWLLIILISLMTTIGGAYWNIMATISAGDTSTQDKIVLVENKIEKLKDEDLKVISGQVHLVDGKVQGLVILHQVNAQPTHSTVATQAVTNIQPQ